MPSLLAPADRRLLERVWAQPVHRTELENGLVLLVQPDDAAPVVSVQVWVKTGSQHEGALLGAGLSHYLEHLLFKGTERRVGREISATVQAHGGSINAYTTYDRTVYYIDLPAAHLEVAVDLLADMALHSTLPADEVARERDVILREIAMGDDDHDRRHWDALARTVFKQHPLREPVIGHRDVFSAVSREELLAYYRERYAPNNLVVVIAGDISAGAARASVEKHFGGAARRRLAPVFQPAEPVQLAPRTRRETAEVEQSRGAIAWPSVALTHPDAPLLDLLAVVIGHGDSSPLWQQLREKQRLVHSIDAHHWSPGEAGLFAVFFTCDPDKREAAERGVRRELERLATKGFTRAELARAVRQLVVGELGGRKTTSRRAARLGSAEVVAGDLDFSRTWFERVAQATPAELRRVLREWLAPARENTVSLDPKPTAAKAAKSVAAKVTKGEEWTSKTLPNGVRLLLRPDDRQPNLHIQLICEGGPLFEAAGKRGASALLSNMLTKDTAKRDAAEVAAAIEAVGGSFSPLSGNNTLGLSVEVLPGDADLACELLRDAVLTPAFAARTFAVERDAELAQLQQDEDDVVSAGHRLARQKFFGAHAFALDAHGDAAGVSALKPADLRALWKRLAVGGNVVVAVAGDFETKTLVPALSSWLAKLPRGGVPTRPERHKAAAAARHVQERECQQALVFDAFPGPGALHADDMTATVLHEILSGMAARLFERVREEKGLAYFVSASRVVGVEDGMFYLYAGTQPGKEDEVLAEFDAELARIAAGEVTEEERVRAITRLQASRRMRLQTNAARAGEAAVRTLLGLPMQTFANWDARLAAVGIAQLKAFAGVWLKPKLRQRLVVRPPAA
ncbi:MAG: pitrilysin family protein [Verrucomicrobia bacterium]|nr:pitrilysin family protein [Verrucomicrobiota bacterium]